MGKWPEFFHFYHLNLYVLFAILQPENRFEELSSADYRKLFDEFYRPIRNFIYFKCGDTDLAEDLAQDVFVKLWENRGRIDRKTVKSYLYTIAQNMTINHLKRKQLHFRFMKERPDDRDYDTPAKLAEMEEYSRQLERIISSLPEGGRVVFLMNRIDDMTYQEIAESLSLSVKAVEKRMSKVLRILRESLGVDI